MENKKTTIYGLYVVNKPEEIRYVGKSDNPKLRLKRHIYNVKLKIRKGKKLTHKDYWLLKNDFNVNFIVLEECSYDVWGEREKYYIKKYKNLTNTSSGGLGGCGITYKKSYSEVKEWVNINLTIKSKNEWYDYIKDNILPDFIPSNPREVYLNRGWLGWGDFLGTGRVWDNLVEYLTYEEAKIVIKNMCINSGEEYKKLAKSGEIPPNIPNRPERYYKKRGWLGWGDFLGTGRVSNNKRIFVPYKEFKKYIKKNNITTLSEFKKHIKGKFGDIPSNPNTVYSDVWVGWGDVFDY